jgi:hypothetical protein
MSKKTKGGLLASRQVKEARRCVYCGRKTRVPESLTNEPLARYSHSTSKQEIPPLCEASLQGKIAQRSTS